MKFMSIQTKIISVITLLLLLTMGFVTWFVYNSQQKNMIQEAENELTLNMESLIISLQNMMLNGNAPIMVKSMRDLKNVEEYRQIAIFRTNGTQAFSDLSTLDQVNQNQDKTHFLPTTRVTESRTLKHQKHDLSKITEVLNNRRPLRNLNRKSEEIEFYFPIYNLKNCMVCHGSDHTVRGIANMKVSVAGVYHNIRQLQQFMIAFFAAVGIFLILMLLLLIRSIVLKPVLRIGKNVEKVGAGNLDVHFDLHRNDELGRLGDQLNDMIQGLIERFQLTKYVSQSTRQIVKSGGGDKAQRKEITVLFSDIRGFTSYSESHPTDEVIRNLNIVLQNQSQVIEANGGDIDKFLPLLKILILPSKRPSK